MIETFFGADALGTHAAFLVSLLIGVSFGVALERAGFGSSRKLSGIFYGTDMTVLKVMFTAVITAMLLILYSAAFGLIGFDSLYLMPTVYGAQAVAGILFGIGFVMGGWCPGTAAVGCASGKADAFLFLAGAAAGSILFNELYGVVKPLYSWGESGVQFVYASLGVTRVLFAFIFTAVAIGSFWMAEWVEKKISKTGYYLNSPFLWAFSIVFIAAAGGLLAAADAPAENREALREINAALTQPLMPGRTEQMIMEVMQEGRDHIEPEDLADRLMMGDRLLTLVDIRPKAEYDAFHIRGAVNIEPAGILQLLREKKNAGMIVLYSNGMTHPAQVRDALHRQGYRNVYILTDGLDGFVERCLKPASLRAAPVTDEEVSKIRAWREYFSGK
ncbi:MAG TPA: rhodanese-like domain-containing protein [bacterium]|nr:rhodanese-like domain-containing protein [bacterium]